MNMNQFIRKRLTFLQAAWLIAAFLFLTLTVHAQTDLRESRESSPEQRTARYFESRAAATIEKVRSEFNTTGG
jgi:hypothetical protein